MDGVTMNVKGVALAPNRYDHPRWDDGTPMLIDQEVRHKDGWEGFISGIPYPEELLVIPYGDEDVDSIECSPEELTRIDPATEPCDGTEPHTGPWAYIPKSDQASECACGYVLGK